MGTAVFVDNCSWNFFHNQVEEHISNLSAWLVGREQRINYNQLVLNPVSNKYTKYGSADLYLKSINEEGEPITRLWDVKPASYLINPKKSLGEQ